jgi:putative transposase
MNAVYKVAGVSKQAVHQCKKHQLEVELLTEELITQVDEIRSIHPGCGLAKLYDTLNPSWLGRDKFINLFMELGYRVKKQPNYIRTTYPSHLRYPNLIEGLLVWDKNRVWQTDITYFEVNGRFFYLTFIIDIYTKVIKGYAVSDHLRAEANLEALQMAIGEGNDLRGLIHHSDRGSQFIETTYRDTLTQRGIAISMGLIAQDNAYAERINGTIKNEYLKSKTIRHLRDLKREVKIAVDHYNEKRIHRHLPNKQSPTHFEKQLVHLGTQNRPKVIVYTEGNPKISAALSRPDFYPETRPQVHVCPMVTE